MVICVVESINAERDASGVWSYVGFKFKFLFIPFELIKFEHNQVHSVAAENYQRGGQKKSDSL